MKANKDRGQPLPHRYIGLKNFNVRFRKGQISLIVAAAGVGKSSWIMDYGLFADYSGMGDMVPTMLFSNDTDESLIGKRATAAIIGKDLAATDQLLRSNDAATWRAQEEATNHMWCNFEASPDIAYIANEMDAYCYAMGSYPDLVIIDALMNVRASEGGGHGMSMDNLYNAMEKFHWLSRTTGAHFAIVHHTTGGNVDGDRPVARSDIMGKIDKHARLVLGIWKPGPDLMTVSVIKNNDGPSDSKGEEVAVTLPFMPTRSWIGDTL